MASSNKLAPQEVEQVAAMIAAAIEEHVAEAHAPEPEEEPEEGEGQPE